MTVIGIDVAKDSLVAARVSSSGRLKESFEIENKGGVVESCLDELVIKYPHLLVACEATGDCHTLLAKSCLQRQIPFRLLNPIITKQFTRSTVRKKKTDLSDAWVIAKLALQGEGSKVTMSSFSPSKTIHRTASKLVKVNQAVKLMVKRFASLLPEELELISQLNSCVEKLDDSAESFRKKAREQTDTGLTKLLTSIPGVGERTVVTLINEIDDINRFSDPKSLVAYAGLDPRVKQSGTSLKHNTHITKRGSPYLRRDIFISSVIACRWEAELKEYYLKKRGEGKRHKEAIVAVSRKLLNRVYAVWKRGTPYVRKQNQIMLTT
jgi:transposase